MEQTRTASRSAWAALLFVVLITFGASFGVSFFFPLVSDEDFNVVDWELRHLSGKWLYLGGQLVHGKPTAGEEDATVARYLNLTGRIERLRSSPTDVESTELIDLEGQRAEIENDVEAILEGRVTEALEVVGLDSSLPLFPDATWVFPPVDVELGEPPYEFVASPRDRIELIDQRPLRSDLAPSDIIALEAEEERSGDRSVLIEPLSGVATYPSLVQPDSDYRRLVEIVGHEWVHQYLFFHPLGLRFGTSVELRTLNETVATIVGRDLADVVIFINPLRAPYDRSVSPRPVTVDVGAALRQLRIDVDALLAFGQIEEAEALMEQRRRELAAGGVLFRRINQAFFAFRNVYATDPGSTDPIGFKLAALRQLSGSVDQFLRTAADFTSQSDLDDALAAISDDTGR